ncbi:TnsD family transposase [Pseudoalteromonas sp. MMG022]|uniref:TnsD family transposase n=1 Tax=Pseudoalteromonas sp. MMG022 TaxID=2909978 RepID=UPI001F40A9D6|nr:TnsD family transposase [Pseudoalteromonas sp. MMG022]MCF6437175.1 TnsD family transposase [Pseudoalteromonas sp. MMG022]
MQLPTSLPDETLFSRYIRHMTILGLSEHDYLSMLLAKPRASVHPYLTIGIRRAAKICGDSETKIYREQTLGRLFSYFLPQYASSISQALRQCNGNNAIRACQLVTFKESETLSLKYCPVCAKEDIRRFGVTYWHRNHQIPGVEACSVHRVWLIHEKLPERPHIKKLLLPAHSSTVKQCTDLSFEFAKFTKQFLRDITETNSSFCQAELLTDLSEHGYAHGNKRFNRQKLTSDLFKFVQDLEHTAKSLLPSSDKDYRYLSYMLTGTVCQHPFKYLLVLFWLNNLLKGDDKLSLKNSEKKYGNEDKSEFCQYLLKQGNSMEEVSRITGKSRCYIKSLAMKNNIPIELKPKVITEEVITSVISMAYKGFHRKAIAKEFQISTGSVEQIISSEEGLVEKRKQFKFESKKRKYKVQILRTIRLSPFASKQEVKQSCYAAFHWLYRHDRAWLNSTLPAASKTIPPKKVNWGERDKKLAVQVQSIFSEMAPNESISLTKLDRLLGGHGWLTRMRTKLPITMSLVKKRYC